MMIESNERLASFRVDRLEIVVYSSRRALGAAAAEAVAERIRVQLRELPRIGIIFAAAPSQDEFLAALGEQMDLDWQRITVFQMDEYIALPADAPQSFGQFLRERLFDRVRPGAVHYLDTTAPATHEIERYARLISEMPPAITCAGIGENGHLAFNDPPFVDLDDPVPIKVVHLAEASRWQQVHDGCFNSIEEVPISALTLTVPTLLSAPYLSCVVPASSKAEAVRRMLLGPVDSDCPASFLRRHPHALLYLDRQSAARIPEIFP